MPGTALLPDMGLMVVSDEDCLVAQASRQSRFGGCQFRLFFV
jgi:hypothetical protein